MICLGIFCIACTYMFSLWQLRKGVNSLVKWLEHWIFIRADWVRIQGRWELFFSYASFICYFSHVIRWGLLEIGLFRWKWLHVIINDNFLEEGECYGLLLLPSIICLGRFRIACTYIFNRWQLREGRLFSSVVRALGFYLGRQGSNPMVDGKFSAILHSFVTTHVVRTVYDVIKEKCNAKKGPLCPNHKKSTWCKYRALTS